VSTPEIILILGAEEGSITLYGVKLKNEWHFLLKYEGSTYQKGFQNAIDLLDEYSWHTLIPRMIHPEFAEPLLTEIEKRLHPKHFRLAYWRRLVARSLRLTKMIQ
jgi:hypothetical protein